MTEKGTVFFPERYLEATPADYGLEPYEDVFFPAADGTRLHGWYVDGADQRAVLLWFHGNAGNISHRLDNLKRLQEALEIPIFIFDYREYGRSEGEISKAGTFSDARGAYRYLTEVKKFPGGSVLLFGRSLGTALAVWMAVREPCLGVILEAAFTSTDDMMRLYFPYFDPQSMSPIKYDSMSLIAQVPAPLLFLHGQADQTIPLSMAQRLYQQATGAKFFHVVPGGDHNDTYLVGGREYFKVWRDFFNFCIQHQTASDSLR